jgi:hypothetical protein
MKIIHIVAGYHSTRIAVTKMNGMLTIAYKRIEEQLKCGVLERLIGDYESVVTVVRSAPESVDIEKISARSNSSINVKSLLDSRGIGVSSLKSLKEASLTYANSVKESLNKIDFSLILLKDEKIDDNLEDGSVIKTAKGFSAVDSNIKERISSFATFSTDLFSGNLFGGDQKDVVEGIPPESDASVSDSAGLVVADKLKPQRKGNNFYDLDSSHY